MQWEFIVALVISIPIILFPVVFVWYLNIGAIAQVAREVAQKRKAARAKENRQATTIAQRQ